MPSGTGIYIPTAQLGDGTADATTFLRGDQTYAAPPTVPSDGDKGDVTVSGSGTVWTVDNDTISNTKLRNSAALSVIGRSANSTGDPGDIAASAEHQTLRVLSDGKSLVLGFGALNLASSAAVSGVLPPANGGSHRTLVTLESDVASSASTSFQNITGLSFSMTSGTTYKIYALLLYTTSANTIGLRVSFTGPAMTHGVYRTETAPGNTTGGVPAAGTANTWTNWQNAADTGTTSGASMSTTAGNMVMFEGVFRPSGNGTFQLRFAPETATLNGVIIEAGSTLEYW